MGSWGVARGVTSTIGQVGSGLGKRLFAKDKRVDLEAERSRFFGEIEAQAASLDPAARSALLSSLESQWSTLEAGLLMSNAQATQELKKPLIDVKRVALDVAEGALVQAQVVGVAGGLDLDGMLSGAAVQGVIEGFAGDDISGTVFVPGAGPKGTSVADAATGAAGAVLAQGVQDTTAKAVNGMRGNGEGQIVRFKLSDDTNPARFLGLHPETLNARDLYREFGFIGWKRFQHTETLQVYVPVIPDPATKAELFVIDASSGQVLSAFRILKTTAASFGPLVDQLTTQERSSPRYASGGSELRAVWDSGVFLTADSQQVGLGWSRQASQTATPHEASGSTQEERLQ